RIVSQPQTLATLKVSGVRNISPVRRVSEHSVFAEAWGIILTCEQEVAHDVAFLGVRASYLSKAAAQEQNVFLCKVHRTSDSRFERVVTLSPATKGVSGDKTKDGAMSKAASDSPLQKSQRDKDAPPVSSSPSYPPTLQWRLSKLAVPEVELPVRGQELCIHIPADQIYLVTD
ncbi:MAG: hypothetical protein LBU48_04530, partial [Coriobacteriales bacterium]|nr:hypothetical protein [Coriobacteriales bacterium]